MLQWADFTAKKPIAGKNHPDDEKLLSEAKENIGDYKLKESDTYKVPRHLRETTVTKYLELLEVTLRVVIYLKKYFS